MDLVITEEQRMLQRAARDFVSSRSSLKRVRSLRDASLRGEPSFSREAWSEMAKLGWLDPDLPAGFSRIVHEELGRGLLPEPLLSSVALGGGAIKLGGTRRRRASTCRRSPRARGSLRSPSRSRTAATPSIAWRPTRSAREASGR